MVGGGKNKSGTSVSVKYALDFNKEVLALPCNVTGDDLTNSLIQDGARSVLGRMTSFPH
jgi:predicted Rossmann fold nucleotide-binding protein DprA/Smf involved in DNA uptake